jgi:hypothetical protein
MTFCILVFCKPISAQNIKRITKDVIQMELNRSKAIASRDSLTLDRMYAPDFTGVTALGYTVVKKDLMDLFRRDNSALTFVNDEHKVCVVKRDVAILTGRITATEKATGKITGQSLYMHVLIKKDGRWQILRGQGTNLPLK